jgi:UDP-N-acetylglucosamine acyltransferase
MAYTHVAHDSIVGSRTIFANAASLAGHVEVQDDATVGAFSGVHQFCRVGAHGFIGGYSAVNKDVLPYSRTVGNRAKCYGVNTIGLQRKGIDEESIKAVNRAFRILTGSKLNTSQALDRIREELSGVDEVDFLVRFVEESERGVVK